MNTESNFHLLELKYYTFLSNFCLSFTVYKDGNSCFRTTWLNVTSKCLAHSLKNQLYCYCSSKEIPGVTGKFGPGVQNEAGQRLTEFCQKNSLVIANTLFQQYREMTLQMDITRWSLSNQTDYILCSRRGTSSIQSAKTRLGVDYGSDHKLLIAKFRLKCKTVGKNH